MKITLTRNTLTPVRNTSASSRRPPVGQWDLLAVIGLMVCSAVYGICAIVAY